MELHPILDKTTSPNTGLWYVISALGECPSQRVGHTATYIPGPEGHGGKVYVIGGANPNGPFSDTYVLDLHTFSWDTCEAPGLKARYEHSAFTSAANPNQVHVFGGADQGGNHNDIQVLDIQNHTWSTVSTSGTPPSARTYHVMCLGGRFIVYSGGHSGSDPVGDRQVHVYDTESCSWSVVNVKGDPPKPRHGHLVVAHGDKVYVHGGMAGTAFYDDLHILDLKAGSWRCVKQKRGHPSARAAHCGAIHGSDLYILGGMNRDGALDDFHKLDTNTLKWTNINLQGPSPACRLDFAFCMVKVRVPAFTIETSDDMNASRMNARDVLDSQLRMSSAGSVRSLGSVGSLGSAGSQRSSHSIGSTHSDTADSPILQDVNVDPLVVSGSQLPQQEAPAEDEVGEGAEAAAAEDENIEYKTVDMALIIGGMDTEGEIFDDCLVYLIS